MPGHDHPLRNALLAALAPDALRAIEPHLKPVRLRRGTVLAAPGKEITHIYFPHDCVVSLTVAMADGGTAEVATIGREGMVGFVAAFGSKRPVAQSVVQVTGSAEQMSVLDLHGAFAACPALRRLCLRYVEALLNQVLWAAACNALHPVEARLCRWLLMLHDRIGDGALHLTHEFLAEMLGVHRSTVTLAACALQNAGLIRYRRGVITILDRPGLEETSCECYGVTRTQFERLVSPLPADFPLEIT